MRLAVIDLGTNSVRFDVHELHSKKQSRVLHREKMMIRLGQGVFIKGKIEKNATARAMHAFHHFRRIIDDLSVDKIIAFGTSALREAVDGEKFIQKIRSDTGIELKIISGDEEAKLIAKGILAHEKISAKTRCALVDIGGGSTEINICRQKKVVLGHSFGLGTARLQQVFLKKSPPRKDDIQKLRAYIRNMLSQKMQEDQWPKVSRMIGSSGTVKALSKILKKKKKEEIHISELGKLVAKMSTLTTKQLLEIPGMEDKRVDMILAGSILLEEIAWALGASELCPTEFSLRDGILQEELDLVSEKKSSRIDLHMNDLYAKAVNFGANDSHLRSMTKFTEDFFFRTRKIHRLSQEWITYLQAALVLRKAGELIGISGYEKHSCYIVENADFPSMQKWESEFIAHLCLHHVGDKVSDKDLNFLGKDKRKRIAFLRILALLRIIDALDLGPKTSLVLRKLRVRGRVVKLCFSGKATAGIENLVIDRKKKLFEEVFFKKLQLQRI